MHYELFVKEKELEVANNEDWQVWLYLILFWHVWNAENILEV